ncbi:MAG: hypothetical protein LBL19_03310 [Spirochaetaceae bacterium]|jgi:rare lipoprotein A|nr:hypothetical protein [Spirochaetaceae bacterium]
MKKKLLVLIGIVCMCMSCTTTPPQSRPRDISGLATYNTYLSGLKAAHAELAFDTRVRITNLNNNRSVIVTITQRIPAESGELIQVSSMAADNIGMSPRGTTPVLIEVLGRPRYPAYPVFPVLD